MIDTAVLFGANRSQAEIEMEDVLSFEEQLLNVRSTIIIISWFPCLFSKMS